MTFELLHEAMWGEPEQSGPSPCSYADILTTFAEPFVKEAENKRDVIVIKRTKLLIAERYMQLRNYVPRNHRYKMSATGHICIWNRFEELWNRLELLELSISPPSFLPPAPPPAKPQTQYKQVGGIFVAEEDDE